MSRAFSLIARASARPLFRVHPSCFLGQLSCGQVFESADTQKLSSCRSCPWTHPSQTSCFGSYTRVQNADSSTACTHMFGNTRHYSVQLKQADNPSLADSSQGHLVYAGRQRSMLRTLKIFSLSTSVLGLALQPYLLLRLQDMPLVAAVPFFGIVNMFVFLNPFLIHYIAKKYILKLYFDPASKVFTAHVLTFFARREVISFVAADVVVPDVPNMFAMLNIKGRPFFVNEVDFHDIEVYKHLMGFDRPLDLTYVPKDSDKTQQSHDDQSRK